MTRKIVWLVSILGLQIALVAVLLLLGVTRSGEFVSKTLFSFNQEQLDKIIISDPQAQVVIQKVADQWILPALNDLPASSNKIHTLVNRLLSLKTNWPVATTAASHQRFELTDDIFRRKLELFSRETHQGTLFLGTSPGFKKSHVRMQGKTEVFAMQLNDYDTPATSNDWLDKALLATKAVTRIKGKGFELTKNDVDKAWQLSNGVDGETLDLTQAEELSKAFSTIQVAGVTDDGSADMQGSNVIKLEVNDGEVLQYQLLASADKYYIKRSDIDPVFTLNQYQFERLTQADRKSLTGSAPVGDRE